MSHAALLPRLARRWWTWAVLALIVAAALLGGRAAVDLSDAKKTSIPIPSLVYAIEATSNGHTASILNLGITPFGVPQVPIPVDVNGDLFPDVTVAVNLVDVQGIHNPPDLGRILAPNIEINRYPLQLGTTILGLPAPPVRINVRFDVFDLQGQEDTMHVRFGYDTGQGGSMPNFFQATLKGLDEFYNPLEASISTKGDLLGMDADPIWYEGPLTVIGGFEQGTLKADLGLEFAPFPDKVDVKFAQDGDGAHIDYAHGRTGDVDLNSSVVLQDGADRTTVDAKIERLPHVLGVDIADDPDGGGITFDSKSDGRLADVDVRFRGPLAGDVFDAHLNIEELPSHMAAAWSMPADGSVAASFDSSGQGIGAIEALITNKAGAPTGLPAFAFAEQQVLAVHQNAATDGLRVGGRLERIRSASVTSTPEGEVDAQVNVGDGELPLEIDGYLDLRDDDLPLIDANAVISPLPGDIGVTIEPGESTEADPMTLTYRTAESPDIDGSVKLRDPEATSSTCGAAGVICADLRIRHVPTLVEARIFDLIDDGKREAHIEVDADGVDKPDLFADVVLGPEVDSGGKPLVAHAEVLGLTQIARIRTVEGADDTLERAEFHTCDFDYETDSCIVGTEDRVGLLNFAISNFLPESRPGDLAPAYAATPNFATIVARGRDGGDSVDFEATGRMESIKEVTYVNDGAFGVRTNIGGGGDLAAVIDIDGIRFEDEGDDTEFYDITGDVLISPLPETMSFCMNESGQDIVSPTSTITAECQQGNPFDTEDDPQPDLAKSPLSVAYDGATPFNVTVDAELHALGVADSDDRDDRTIRGHLDVENIPSKIRAHILDPKDVGGGPMLVKIDSPGATDQVNVGLRAELLDADLQCEDPRVPDEGHSAVCASGRIEHLPNRVGLEYDPEKANDNFVLDTSGTYALDLKDLKVSSVERDDEVDRAKVLIAEAQILGLPKRVAGTLTLPAPEVPDDPVAVDLTATPPLATIDATVRNFIAPDPIPDMPPQRNDLPDPDDYASFIQRGDAFKAVVHVTSIARVGFKNQVSAAGKRLDTSVINVDFGIDKVIRGYVDLDADGTQRLTGDVTLKDVPAGLQVCFRGPKEAATATIAPAAGTETFCDVNPAVDPDDDPNPQTKQGAFELRMAPNSPALELDVDAFVRHSRGAGADVIAARLNVDNIPNVVAGTFGDGKADVGGFRLDGTPEGIDRIKVHAASFDIKDDGWNDETDRPYPPRFVDRAPFPAPEPAIQHVAVRADEADFEIRAQLGALDNIANSEFHRVRLSDEPCKKPTAVDYKNGPVPNYGNRPDFPYLPDDAANENTCIRADFKPDGPSTVDPLDLSVVLERDGERLALHDAGLDDMPEFVQINLADANPLQLTDPKMRPHCVGVGDDEDDPDPQPANCIAPLARVDTPGTTHVFGVVEVGSLDEIDRLNGVVEREALPDLTLPTTWGEDGVRARIGQLEDDPDVPDDGGSVIKAGFHLPIPASFTFDQVQSWSKSSAVSIDDFYDASDLHFRYASRNPDGSSIANLGRLSALIHSFSDGGQILISDDDPNQGFEIPGELGVEMYVRDNSGAGRSFMQIDGRSSARDLDMRVRMLGGASEDAIARLDAQIRNVPAIPDPVPATTPLEYSPDNSPSFRLRTEIMGEGQTPPDPTSESTPTGGEPEKEQECSPLLCVMTQVRLESVNAQFDFAPTPAQPARLLEAAIRTDGAKNGLEVRGFQDVHGGDGAGDGRFLAGAQLSVDPINIFLHAGIPFLGSLDFIMLSDLDAAVSLGGNFAGFDGTVPESSPDDSHIFDQVWNQPIFGAIPQLTGPGTTRFSLKQNLLHMEMANGVAGDGDSRLGPIDFHVDIMHGEAWALFVKLIGIDFLPPGDTLRIPFLNCNAGGILPTGLNSVRIPAGGTKNVVAWPFFPAELGGNIFYSGLLKPLADLAASLGGPFFCLVKTDQELMDGVGGKVHPADPLGAAFLGSTVPDAEQNPGLTPVADPPDPPFTGPPDLVLANNVAMCGTHSFNNLTVPSGFTLSVATATNNGIDERGLADDPNDSWPVACPTGATVGELTLVVAHTLQVNGTVQASERSGVGTNATGNSGGGHGIFNPSPFVTDTGSGGNGGNGGTGGPELLDPLNDPIFVGAGPAGSSNGAGTAGKGGAVVKLLTDILNVGSSGKVLADGQGGGAAGSNTQCFVPDTDPPPGDQSVANSGVPGGGGGAGGGIVISSGSMNVALGGEIAARGGAGGAGSHGGGGGGGGGSIKVLTALRGGALPLVTGGGGGGTFCPGDPASPSGAGGEVGSLRVRVAARSKVDINAEDFGFWHSTADSQILDLPYRAVATSNPANDMDVVLCRSFLARTSVNSDPNAGATDLAAQLFWSGGLDEPTLSSPCGVVSTAANNPLVSGPSFVTYESVDGNDISDSISAGTNLTEGYHGYWTVIWKSDTDGNDCFNHFDFFVSDIFSGTQFDEIHCSPEESPPSADIVVGIDNSKPNVRSISLNGTPITNGTDGAVIGPQPLNVASRDVQVSWTDDDAHLSEIVARQCTPDAPAQNRLSACTSGQVVTVDGGDGVKTIGIRVTDAAGNTDQYNVSVKLDTTAPTSDGDIVDVPDAPLGDNQWYQGSPHFRLDEFNDGAGTGPGTPPFRYQFDEGDLRDCPLVCNIDGTGLHQLPGLGHHTLYWRAFDLVGNQTSDATREAQKIPVKIDGELPTSEILSVPAAPNGANGWFSGPTWVSFGAFDQPGASGFTPNVLEGETDTAGIFYSHFNDGDLVSFGEFDPLDPIRLGPGDNDVCWTSRDIAGNQEPVRCAQYLVDEADPIAANIATGGTSGLAGWYTAGPDLTAAVTDVDTDGTDGSGVGNDLGPTGDVCGQRPVIDDPALSGTCTSIDGAPFLPIDPADAVFTLGEGRHEVRTFSTDRAGRRSAIDTNLYKVDLSKPVTAARTITPEPSNGRWHRAVATVVLRAADGDRHSSGVADIRYQVTPGTATACTPTGTSTQYTKPFTVGEGVWTVRYWSVDAAGRTGDCTTLPVAVDLTRPVAKALKANPFIWLRVNLLGIIKLNPQTTQLNWSLQENLSGSVGEKVDVDVVVYDILGNPIKRLDAGQHVVPPGGTLNGAVAWNGRPEGPLGIVPLGLYYYRVVAYDAAGNPTMSSESRELLVVRVL